MKISRRTCLKGCATVLGMMAMPMFPSSPRLDAFQNTHEAMFYEKLPNRQVHCLLCPNSCVREDGELGKCKVRKNIGGRYHALTYGVPCVLALDPVAKFPLFHFSVSGMAFSIATAGCNLSCQYCQNWQFSQSRVEETKNFSLTPEQVVSKAQDHKARAIGFFYTEPTIYFEYMIDIARYAKKAGLKTIMVTGGYINPTPMKMLLPIIDAFVVGLKGFSEKYYSDIIGGRLEPVKEALRLLLHSKRHFEVVTLLLPTMNDSREELIQLATWYRKNLGPDIPWHVTRFTPQYRLKSLPPTPVPVLEMARQIGRDAGIRFVYTGNIPGHEGNHTHCPSCGKLLIERLGFQEISRCMVGNACPECRTVIPGQW